MVYEADQPYGAPYADPYAEPVQQAPIKNSNTLLSLSNFTGAVVSLALIGGLAVWGYQLIMRDVNGIPVVRAQAGEMRVRPADPGGDLARHQGLAVNAVAAEGEAEAPADRLVLSPQPVELAEEDLPMDEQVVSMVQQALADQMVAEAMEAARVQPGSEAETQTEDPVVQTAALRLTDALPGTQSEATEEPAPKIVVIDAPGLRQSLRPKGRPAGLATIARYKSTQGTRADTATQTAVNAALTEALTPAAAAQGIELDPAQLPAGTRLAQLGAYDSPEQARSAWARAEQRHGDLMLGKKRVIEAASSGGRSFYRLRAQGFTDLADARRFCAAITAEGGDCIPAVTR